MIGLLGGVASGKTFVAKEFERLGAVILDADRAGHEVLRAAAVVEAVRKRWGPRVFDAQGNVDRTRLAAIVFAPAAKSELNYLEELTHPRIGALLQLEAAKAGESGCPLVVLDAPVMRKAGWDKMCQAVVYVDAPREVRLARAHQRGWADAQFAAREAAQESILAKRQAADYVIDNSGDATQTREQVEHLWQTLQEN